MYYVKPRHVGEDGFGMFDPDRRDRLPANTWRAVPPNTYWSRAAAAGDVFLRFDTPPAQEIEGYVAPEPAPARARRSDG